MNRQSILELIADLLEYPTAKLISDLKLMSVNDGYGIGEIEIFIREVLSRDLYYLQEIYVETFDMSSKTNLYLSYHVYGDRSKRGGLFLASLMELYNKYGFNYNRSELPDYIPTMLRFIAKCNNKCIKDTQFKHLISVLSDVIDKIRKNMPQENPYIHLLNAVKIMLSEIER